jgi:hypothetical protein
MTVKSVFQSKTIWANAVAVGVAVFQHYFGAIAPADPNLYLLSVALINIALRFRTSVPVTF